MIGTVGADAGGVKTIIGSRVDATGFVPIPSSATLSCDGAGGNLDCPQFFGPDWVDSTGVRFFGLTNRANPPRCVKSTNGGGTWGLCDAGTASPFVGALDLLGGSMTTAADGSLIAVGDQGANNCIIRRSTDYGTSWSTVFTDTTASRSCGIAFSNPTTNMVRCAQTGFCTVIGRGAGAFEEVNYFSNDYGANWSIGTSFTMVSGDAEFHLRLNNSGNVGVLSPFAVTYASTFAAILSGNNFIVTTAIPTPPGSGASAKCPGSVIFGSNNYVVCGPDPLNTTTYRLFNIIGTTPTFLYSFLPLDTPTNAQSPDFTIIAYNGNVAYMVGRSADGTKINVYVTQDTFNTIIRIASLTPTTGLITGCCRGDMHVWNGKIYFTIAGTGANAVFGKVQ